MRPTSSTSTDILRILQYMPAVSPAGPPPMITTSCNRPPCGAARARLRGARSQDSPARCAVPAAGNGGGPGRRDAPGRYGPAPGDGTGGVLGGQASAGVSVQAPGP